MQPSGAKSWGVRFRVRKQPKKLTLGPYPLLSLALAREQARSALRAVAEGRDPIKERIGSREQARMVSSRRFGVVVADFLERYVKPRNRTWRETERVLTKRDLEPWRERDVASITRGDVLAVLDEIVGRGSPIQANRVLAALKRLFGWSIERGLIEAHQCQGSGRRRLKLHETVSCPIENSLRCGRVQMRLVILLGKRFSSSF